MTTETRDRIQALRAADQLWDQILIKQDLQGCDLSNTDLSHVCFRDSWLDNACLAGSDLKFAFLEGVSLRRADLRGTNLMHARLQQADLRDADLQDAVLPGHWFLKGARMWDHQAFCLALCGVLDADQIAALDLSPQPTADPEIDTGITVC